MNEHSTHHNTQISAERPATAVQNPPAGSDRRDSIFTPAQLRRNERAIAAAIAEHGDRLTPSLIDTLADEMASKYVWEPRRQAMHAMAYRDLTAAGLNSGSMNSYTRKHEEMDAARERVAANRAARVAAREVVPAAEPVPDTADDKGPYPRYQVVAEGTNRHGRQYSCNLLQREYTTSKGSATAAARRYLKEAGETDNTITMRISLPHGRRVECEYDQKYGQWVTVSDTADPPTFAQVSTVIEDDDAIDVEAAYELARYDPLDEEPYFDLPIPTASTNALRGADLDSDRPTTVTVSDTGTGTVIMVGQHVDIDDKPKRTPAKRKSATKSESVPAVMASAATVATVDVATPPAMIAVPVEAPAASLRVSLLQEDLKAALVNIKRVLPTRSKLPALQYVKIATNGYGELEIQASSGAVTITETIRASIETEGAVCVDGRLIAAFVATQPKGELSLVVDGDVLKAQSGRNVQRFTLWPVDKYPTIAKAVNAPKSATRFSVWYPLLETSLRNTIKATAKDENRPVLAGIHFRSDRQGRGMRISSADGFRMATDLLTDVTVSGVDVIVHAKAVDALVKSAAHYDSNAYVTIVKDRVYFTCGTTEISSTMIDGTFPDIVQIVPKEVATTIRILRESLLETVKSARQMARENNDVVYFTVNPDPDPLTPGNIEVSATSQERGNYVGYVDASVSGDGFRFALSAQYIIDVLSTLTCMTVRIGANGANKAVTIQKDYDRPTGKTDLVHVIMPMVIGG